MKVLLKNYFEQSPLIVAQDLIGKIFQIKTDLGVLKLMVVETEAYLGDQDSASHAYKKQTESNAPMFMDPGTLYVYFTYGMHYCMNVTCWPKGKPGAVLFRGLQPLSGADILYRLSGKDPSIKLSNLTNGPGKITKALGIDKSFNGYDITKKSSKIKIFENVDFAGKVVSSPRIGISNNKEKLWRFYLSDCQFVSKYKFN